MNVKSPKDTRMGTFVLFRNLRRNPLSAATTLQRDRPPVPHLLTNEARGHQSPAAAEGPHEGWGAPTEALVPVGKGVMRGLSIRLGRPFYSRAAVGSRGREVAPSRATKPDRKKSALRAYHLDLAPGDLPPLVLVPGDVDRVQKIAASWDASEPLARRRQFVSYRGRFHGVELGVVSSGIGGPAMSITVEELAALGVRTLLRIGSCGALQPGIRRGDLMVPRATVRFDGASLAYAPAGYPASADPEVYLALLQAAKVARARAFGGVSVSFDTFYVGQGRPGFGGYLPPSNPALIEDLRRMGVIGVEMECATLFTLSSLYGLRAGAVCAVYSIGDRDRLVPRGETEAISTANEAAVALSRIPLSGPRMAPSARGRRA